eukprot:NODE_6985_length_470_cov_68.028916.p1 GENE.NODE_6985_length_470_cov_68.028916~~NODE_6985_length_470_cov_68.028916.p1  ORF type:complete len:105 (+),score=31.71 NODE_6985_length_470_cov_68.028916:37-351(+)
MGNAWMASSALFLAKTVRDKHAADHSAANELLRPRPEHWLLTVGGFVTSIAMTTFGIVRMPMKEHQRRFLLLGGAYVLSSALQLAKLLRDDEELRRTIAKARLT